MKLFKYTLKKSMTSGIEAMSIVNDPAIKLDFLKLNKEYPSFNVNLGNVKIPGLKEGLKEIEVNPLKLSINEKEHIVSGPALIPNQKIYRTAESLGIDEDGFVYFEAETVKHMFYKFMMNMHMNNVTLDHEVENSDFKLIEAWLTNDTKKDKAYALGYELPSGSVMLSYKVINDKMWERVLNGEFNGFSIEGHDFDREEIDLSMNNEEVNLNEDDMVDITVNYLNKFMRNYNKDILSEDMKLSALDICKEKGETLEMIESQGYTLHSKDFDLNSDNLKLSIRSDPDAKSIEDGSNFIIRYRYEGPRDEKNRDFCANMLDLNLLYRKEDINQMSFRSENKEFGTYSIFKYKGSYNCRHEFERLIFFKATAPKVT